MRKDYVEINNDLFEVVLSVDEPKIEIGEVNWWVVTQGFSPTPFSDCSLKNDNIDFFSR